MGCGPGVVVLELACLFAEAIGLDPDPDMLAEARRRAAELAVANVRWVQALAEELGGLGLGRLRLVTFGQSFHWTDRERVAELVYDALEGGGALALIVHTQEGRPRPRGPDLPDVPHEVIRGILDAHLGPQRRAGQGLARRHPDRYEDALARTRFGRPTSIFLPGRADIVRDADGVIASYLGTSFAAPHLFGERLGAFTDDVRAVLATRSASGLFWDWPGDTEVLVARKSARR